MLGFLRSINRAWFDFLSVNSAQCVYLKIRFKIDFKL